MNFENADDILKEKIPAKEFEFIHLDKNKAEQQYTATPVSYFHDAMNRFRKDRGSVICGIIILILIFYAVCAPFFSLYKISDKDGYYAFASPKSMIFEKTGFWDGCYTTALNQQSYDYYRNIPGAIKKTYRTEQRSTAGRMKKWYIVKLDSYAKVGWVKMLLSFSEYTDARNWEKRTGTVIFYPVIDQDKIENPAYTDDQNVWFTTNIRGIAVPDDKGKVQNIFLKDASSADGNAYYITRMNGSQYETRVLYSAWYQYKNGHNAHYLFGADASGYDMFTRLAYGAQLSLILSVCVAAINLLLGIIIGAAEGYYGGTFDLILERIKDILYDVPFVIFMTLFQIYFAQKVGPIISMFFAFIFFGWIGTSSTVRAQFYRFKGQEYVMAARTLGAKDFRLIFNHILPNAIGFIITTSVLTIPGVIFSEANLTYLGIVNLQTDTMTSIGTMLNNGQQTLSEHPHCVFFPAAFISLLLVCFNEFGNGLRDAFNPLLRGAANQ